MELIWETIGLIASVITEIIGTVLIAPLVALIFYLIYLILRKSKIVKVNLKTLLEGNRTEGLIIALVSIFLFWIIFAIIVEAIR